MNLTAHEGNIGQTLGSTIQGQTLFAETKQSGKTIKLTDTDFSNANLKTNNGDITLNDRDGVNLNVQAGTGTANIASDVSSALSVNGWVGTGISLVNGNQANTMNLTANGGDITQTVGSTMSGNALNVKTNNGQVILANDSANNFNHFSATSRLGNVSYRDIDGINITSVNLNTDNNSSRGNLTVQTNGAGNITQTGSIGGVDTLSVLTNTGNVTLTSALNDARNLVAESNQGNVSYRDINDINVTSVDLDKDSNDVRGNLSIQTSFLEYFTDR